MSHSPETAATSTPQTTAMTPGRALSDLDIGAYQRIGWDAWNRGMEHDNCPYHDKRQAPWQFGWRAAEQNYRKALEDV